MYYSCYPFSYNDCEEKGGNGTLTRISPAAFVRVWDVYKAYHLEQFQFCFSLVRHIIILVPMFLSKFSLNLHSPIIGLSMPIDSISPKDIQNESARLTTLHPQSEAERHCSLVYMMKLKRVVLHCY